MIQLPVNSMHKFLSRRKEEQKIALESAQLLNVINSRLKLLSLRPVILLPRDARTFYAFQLASVWKLWLGKPSYYKKV